MRIRAQAHLALGFQYPQHLALELGSYGWASVPDPWTLRKQ
jgi:hypothetical protein